MQLRGTQTVYLSSPVITNLVLRNEVYGNGSADYHAKQEEAARRVPEGYDVVIPGPPHLPAHQGAQARAGKVHWHDAGGESRLPVAFLRLRRTGEEAIDIGRDDIQVTRTSLNLTLHDFGAFVVSCELRVVLASPVEVTDYRNLVEQLGYEIMPLAILDDVTAVRALVTTGALQGYFDVEDDPLPEPKILGFHRIYEFTTRLDPQSWADDVSGLLRFVSDDLEDVCASHPDAFCWVGNGNSLVVARDEETIAEISPRTVVDYFEYVYSSVGYMDDLLFAQVEAIRRAPPKSRELDKEKRRVEQLKDRADLMHFRFEDEIASLPPRQLGYWTFMLSQWRLPELRALLQQKVDAATELAHRLEAEISGRIGRRTNIALSLLTSLGLLSIVVDAVSFTTDGDSIAWGWTRGPVLLGAVLAALAIFFLLKSR